MNKLTPEILINISGGLDSSYTAWQYLKNNPDKTIILFHLNLINTERRSKSESVAVKHYIKWLKRQGLNNFVYKESTFDYGDLRRITIKDIQIVAMFNAIILKNFPTITEIPLCWHKGEVAISGPKGERVTRMFEALEVGRKINLTFPIQDLTRKEMIEQMPIEIQKIISSCRNRDIYGRACGICQACRQYTMEGLKPL